MLPYCLRLSYNGHLDIDFSQFLDFIAKRTKSLKKKYARTNILKKSYFNWIVDEWNSLPLEVRSHAVLTSLKLVLLNF